jgi:phospholipase C
MPAPNAPGLLNRSVWYQPGASGAQVVAPFRLDTVQSFQYMRVEGTPHAWPDSQGAWGEGVMSEWPRYKDDHSMGYFTEQDMPFQFALAEAFTICDAYHCSFMGNTNPNRLFLWTGTNDPLQKNGGPAIYNQYDNVDYDSAGGYTWLTYCERLQEAGISWQVYQNMADNFTDNSVAGFRTFRASYFAEPGADPELARRGLSTRDLDLLAQDVLDGTLPAVSWVVATAEGSEHPGPSSPASGPNPVAPKWRSESARSKRRRVGGPRGPARFGNESSKQRLAVVCSGGHASRQPLASERRDRHHTGSDHECRGVLPALE